MNLKPHILKSLLYIHILFLFALAGNSYSASRASRVIDIKHWSNPSYTRVVINLDREASAYSHRLLKKDPSINKPRRLYVDIRNSSLGRDVDKAIHINDGLLRMARAGQYDRGTVRVVLDIESIEDYKIFHLNEPYRIIIDVTGEKAAGEAGQTDARENQRASREDAPTLSQQLGLKVRKIVIDPGHGGRDPGAIGRSGLKEKDVTLKIGKELKKRLTGHFDRVVMTRETDVYIPLEERTAIANKHDADLFISIHVNASPRRAASGVETYILNISNDVESKRVAARENSTSTRSVSDLEFILNDLIKTAKTNDSTSLATAVQENLVESLRVRYSDTGSNGVKGAPFYVLVGTKMPSILVEVSFITNSTEERRLADDRYISMIVEGIASGVLNYVSGGKTAYHGKRPTGIF